MFTAEATETEPLNYQREWKPATHDSKWQQCDVERFPGADSPTLTIPSVQKPNEGSYRCVVSNCAATQTSNSAELIVGKKPIQLLSFTASLRVCMSLYHACLLFLYMQLSLLE